MSRVKRGVRAVQRRSKVLKLAKGFQGARGRLYRTATEAVDRSLKYAYRDRRAKKRDFRRLWIVRINAAARREGLSYSQLMNGLSKAGVELDRKVLATIAQEDEQGFQRLAEQAKKAG